MRIARVLVFILPLLSSGADKIDELLPSMLKRLDAVREVLAPLPRDVLEEALYHTASYYIPVDSETELCRNHSALLFDSFLSYEVWALKMVDASSKGSPGMLDGHVMDLGNYGQCVNVEAPHQLFMGQHCVIETRGILPADMDTFNPTRPVLPTLRIDLVFSVCVPSTCTAKDVKTHMDIALNSVNSTSIMYNSSCSSAVPAPFQTSDWVAILVLVLITSVIALGTWFDNHTNQSGNQLLKCFSLTHNTKQLFDISADQFDKQECLPCLNGLRILAMAWMMLGYRMLHLLASPNFRFKYLAENIDSLAWAPVENAQLSVEIFFLLTGLLVSYKFFQQQQKHATFSYIKFFIQHYFRMTPPLALMTLLYATVLVRVTEGPIWRRYFEFEKEFCQKHWWTNLLYVSNYLNPYEMCIPQTWYLAVEFQMYILSPLLLLPLCKNPTRGFIYLGMAFLATIVGGMMNTYVLQIQAGGLIRLDRTREGTSVLEYFHTQYRAGSFLMGMALGYVIFKIKHEELSVRLSKVQLWIGWLVALSLSIGSVLGVSVFQDPQYVYTPWLDTAYGVLHRPALSLAVTWVILVCVLGYTDRVNRALSWITLVPLSRVTYCVFLVHFLVQDVQAFSTQTAVTTDFLNLWYMFFADFFISYLLATALYLAVEAPVNNVVSLVFRDTTKLDDELPTDTQLSTFIKNTILADSVHTEKV